MFSSWNRLAVPDGPQMQGRDSPLRLQEDDELDNGGGVEGISLQE